MNVNREHDSPHRHVPLILAVSLATFGVPVALCAQTAVMNDVPGLYGQTYSIDSDFSKSFQFTVGRQGAGDIDFFVTVDGGLQNSFEPRYAVNGGHRIAYYIYDNLTNRNVLKSGAGVGSPNVISGGFSDPSATYENTTVGYSIYVPAGQFLPQGEYSDTLTFTLYTGTPDDYDGASAVSIDVPVVLATELFLGVRLAPPGGTYETGVNTYELDCGTLTQGSLKELDMIVSSTIYFDIAFSSSHQGNLMREGGSELAPYMFRVNDAIVDLSSGWTSALQNQDPTAEGERSYRIEIEIGNVDELVAGNYQDSIIVSVISH